MKSWLCKDPWRPTHPKRNPRKALLLRLQYALQCAKHQSSGTEAIDRSLPGDKEAHPVAWRAKMSRQCWGPFAEKTISLNNSTWLCAKHPVPPFLEENTICFTKWLKVLAHTETHGTFHTQTWVEDVSSSLTHRFSSCRHILDISRQTHSMDFVPYTTRPMLDEWNFWTVP